MKNTLLYVFANARRHGIPFAGPVDPYSSAAWFTGWHELEPSTRPAPTTAPRSWQLRTGWHLHGRLSSDAIPRAGFS